MNKSIFNRKRELHYKSFGLKNLIMQSNNFDKQKEIREQQNDAYQRLKFYEGYENACRSMKC